MKKYLIYLMMAAAIVTFGACSPEDENEPQTPDIENPEKPDDGGEDVPDDPDQPGDNPDTPDSDSKILVAYFSWGGTTQRMAQEIVRQTGADLFRIEPVVPIRPNTLLVPRLHSKRKTTMPVRRLPQRWKIGRTTIRYSSVVPYGGGLHR